MRIIIIFISCIISVNCIKHKNNVCPTNMDYNIKIFNKNCWYNSDLDLSLAQVIQKYRYPFEEYKIITDDGYKLSLFRIPHGKKLARKIKTEIFQPVLLLHGIIANSAPWVTLGNKSMGFILADQGYDVWLANFRGSTYGGEHIHFSTNDNQFWNFSFHEAGVYDIPRILDFIYNSTGRNDTILIGHSQGSRIQLAYASELSEHAKKRVKLMVHMAPSAYVINLKGSAVFPRPFPYICQEFLLYFQVAEIPAPVSLLRSCLWTGIHAYICQYLLMSAFGYNIKNFPPELLPIILLNHRSPTSGKSIVHLLQSMNGKFSKYDYGHKQNKIVYNSMEPPEYNMTNIMIPNLLIYANNDYLSTKESAIALYNALPEGNILYEVKDQMFTHIDFLYSRNVIAEVINDMLKIMNKYKTTVKL